MAHPTGTTALVAANVRAELARQRKSGRAVAEALNQPASTFSRRLSGAIPFTVTELADLAGYLDVPLARFMPEELLQPRQAS